MRDAVVTSTGPLVSICGLRGVVHAVFPSSLYVEPTEGPLLVVHDATHGHTPTSLIVPGARAARWGAAAGDAVAGRSGYLRVGRMLLDARGARAWRPRAARVGSAASPRLLAALVHEQAAGSQRLGADCRRLAAALAAADRVQAASCTAALVGSGQGLTPSGDDALVGMLAALYRAGGGAPALRCRQLLASCIRLLLGRTTTISAHYLRLALDGHFGEHLTDLIDHLVPGAVPDPDLVARLRAIGATSGADALVGVLGGLQLISDLCDSMSAAKEAA